MIGAQVNPICCAYLSKSLLAFWSASRSRARSVPEEMIMLATSGQLTAGIDVGSSAVKVAIAFSDGGREGKIVFKACERIRRRNVHQLVQRMFEDACAQMKISAGDFAYVASTGDADAAPFATGHFYSMTTHARGALFLEGKVRAALDVGALHARAIKFDHRSKVLSHRMTSQCASGSGQCSPRIDRCRSKMRERCPSRHRAASR